MSLIRALLKTGAKKSRGRHAKYFPGIGWRLVNPHLCRAKTKSLTKPRRK